MFGQPFAEQLGIKLRKGADGEIVKWFLAALLYAKPIRESTATKTYRLFVARSVTTARAILATGWDGLVALLDEGGYTRYDFSTADKLLKVFGNLQHQYDGSLQRLHDEARDAQDLEARLKALGKGIGDTTTAIFLREMRPLWSKADPRPTPLVRRAMKAFRIHDLKATAARHRIELVLLETALLRVGKDYLRRRRSVPHLAKCG
jgi:hypothetical protein